MARATALLQFHEEVEKELSNYSKHGKDWTETPPNLTLQGTRGFTHNDNGVLHAKYYPDGHRPAGYGSGNGETHTSK